MIALREIPRIIWIHSILIIAIGLAALYSASFNNVRVGQGVFYDQLWVAGFSLVLMVVLSRTNYRKFFDVAYIVYGISLVFLILVLFLGRPALGATRWFSLGVLVFSLPSLVNWRSFLCSGVISASAAPACRSIIPPLPAG